MYTKRLVYKFAYMVSESVCIESTPGLEKGVTAIDWSYSFISIYSTIDTRV